MPKKITITLTDMELDLSETIARIRIGESRRQALQNTQGLKGDAKEYNVSGVLGEFAVAKHLGIYYAGSVNTFKAIPDVGEYEVRTTKHIEGRLNIFKKDLDNRKYILVIDRYPEMDLIGWIKGSVAKEKEFYGSYKVEGRELYKLYMVPQYYLDPMTKIKDIIKNDKKES